MDRKCSECIHLQVCQFRIRLENAVPNFMANRDHWAVICKLYKYKGDGE